MDRNLDRQWAVSFLSQGLKNEQEATGQQTHGRGRDCLSGYRARRHRLRLQDFSRSKLDFSTLGNVQSCTFPTSAYSPEQHRHKRRRRTDECLCSRCGDSQNFVQRLRSVHEDDIRTALDCMKPNPVSKVTEDRLERQLNIIKQTRHLSNPLPHREAEKHRRDMFSLFLEDLRDCAADVASELDEDVSRFVKYLPLDVLMEKKALNNKPGITRNSTIIAAILKIKLLEEQDAANRVRNNLKDEYIAKLERRLLQRGPACLTPKATYENAERQLFSAHHSSDHASWWDCNSASTLHRSSLAEGSLTPLLSSISSTDISPAMSPLAIIALEN